MDGKLSYGPKVAYDSRVAAGLSRGPTTRRLMNAVVWSNTWPVQNATLDLDFVNDRGFVRGKGQGRVMDNITYTRFSSATYFDKDGLLKTAFSDPPLDYQATTSSAGTINRFLNSQNFADASWAKISLTPTLEPTVLAPDGVSQATRITESSGAITEALVNSASVVVTASINNTISVFAKEITGGEKRYIYIGMRSSVLTRWSWIIYDLARQEYTTRGDGIQNAVVGGNITPLADGWYRISAIVTSPISSQLAGIGITNSFAAPNSYNFGGYTGDGVSGMYIWGAQSELTPANAIVSVPRYDYSNPTTIKAKNLMTFSEDYTARASSGFGSYRAGVRLTAQTTPEIISTPYGNLPFFTLTEDTTAASDHYFAIGRNASDGFTPWPVTAVDPVTFSLIFKRGDRRYLIIRQYSSTPYKQVLFDFDNPNSLVYNNNGSVGNFSAGSVESLGNNIYRISLTTTFIGGGTNWFAIFGADGTGNPTYTGTSSIIAYASGMQFEEGSVSTPYVSGSYTYVAYDQNISPTSNGLLIEEGRINYAQWCRDLTNVVWVKQNMSVFRDQVGLDGISNTASRLVADTDNATVTQLYTAGGSGLAASVYVKRLTGSGNIQLTADGIRWTTIPTEENKWKRIALIGTITNPTIGIRIMTAGDSVVVDYTQIENNTHMSSPIFTTGVASSRGLDFTAIFNPTFDQFFNQREGTFYVEFDILAESGNSDNQSIVSASTSNNSLFTSFFVLDERNFVPFIGPVPVGAGIGWDDATNRAFKGAYTYGRKYHGALNNGTSTLLFNSNVSGGIPSYANLPYDRFGIGFQIRNPSSYTWMQGRVKRVVYVPYFINSETDFTLIGDK